MRFIILGAVSLMIFGMTASASAAENPTKTLTDIETNWGAAFQNHDPAALDKILGSDWIGRDSDGIQQEKAQILAVVKDPARQGVSTNRDVMVRVVGTIAVVQGYNDEKSSYNGKDTSGTYNWTDIFEMRQGHWIAIASQTTKVVAK